MHQSPFYLNLMRMGAWSGDPAPSSCSPNCKCASCPRLATRRWRSCRRRRRSNRGSGCRLTPSRAGGCPSRRRRRSSRPTACCRSGDERRSDRLVGGDCQGACGGVTASGKQGRPAVRVGAWSGDPAPSRGQTMGGVPIVSRRPRPHQRHHRPIPIGGVGILHRAARGALTGQASGVVVKDVKSMLTVIFYVSSPRSFCFHASGPSV